MRIVFNIDVGIDVPSFVQAGEILDKITRDLNETLDGRGTYDIAQFQTRHGSEFAGRAETQAQRARAVSKYASEQEAVMAGPHSDTFKDG